MVSVLGRTPFFNRARVPPHVSRGAKKRVAVLLCYTCSQHFVHRLTERGKGPCP